jgi:hypothetical protein
MTLVIAPDHRIKARPASIAAVVESVTPQKAEEYLRTMVSNRKESQKKIIEYAIAMEAGQWSLNGETLKFDSDGRLFDGQNRCRACILAGVPFLTYVVRGISDKDAFATVDTGKSRTHADIFAIGGWQNNQTASSAAMAIYCIANNLVDWNGVRNKRLKRDSTILKKFQGAMPSFDVVSQDKLREFAETIRDELETSVRFANSSKARKVITGANIAALHYLFRQRSVTQVEQFFADLGEGLGLKAGDPVHLLREKLLQAKRAEQRMERWYILGLCIKAWNKRREGEDLRVLRVIEDEDYPKVK